MPILMYMYMRIYLKYVQYTMVYYTIMNYILFRYQKLLYIILYSYIFIRNFMTKRR